MEMLPAIALLLAAGTHAAPAQELAPWASAGKPGDVAKQHLEDITSARRDYAVVQGCTMDGCNCRSPQDTWRSYEQTWESNRSVRMENVGETDVVAPWLANGRNAYRTLDEIVARSGLGEAIQRFTIEVSR